MSAWFAVLFIASLATFIQAFLPIKVVLIGLFVLSAGVVVLRRDHARIYGRLVTFYAVLALIAIIWSVVALFNTGVYLQGVTDALRLYVAWSVAFVLLFTLLRELPSLGVLHRALVVASLAIGMINLAALADLVAETGLITDTVRRPMELYVGLHDGYVQITSNNIGALFLIVPYLLAVSLRRDACLPWKRTTRLALVLGLLVAALSGRRALWFVVLATPSLMILMAAVSRSLPQLRSWTMRTLTLLSVGGALVTVVLLTVPEAMQEQPLAQHLRDAFSATDERSLQKPYLVRGFLDEPFLGSGFGAFAGYTRSEERPWAYELTYHKMLFNLGLIGATCLIGVFLVFLGLAVANLRKWPERSAIPWALLVGVCALFLGAYSNPYFGSFDYLFFIGILPYLATFTRGFDESGSTRLARP